MDIKVFSQFNNLTAGFTAKPDKSDLRRAEMASDAEKTGRYVIRPCLVHSDDILCVRQDMLKEQAYIVVDSIDGLVTDICGVRLTSTHGDCIPIYAFDPNRNVIGLAHAGWKGTALGIAGKLARVMQQEYSCDPDDIYAYIGPGIDKCHFEFSVCDAEKFFYSENTWTKEFIYSAKCDANLTGNGADRCKESSLPDKCFIDLKGINKRFLELAGVKNIEVSDECTYCDEKKFYSYRRSKDMDRMLAYIEIKK